MAKVVGFISEKGGVGKTTACYHIAAALARYHEKKVLVIDADYQRGGITGRFFPELIEKFDSNTISGNTLFTRFQEFYKTSVLGTEIDLTPWNYEQFPQASVDVVISDPDLSTITVRNLLPSSNIIENNRALLRHMQVIDFVLGPLKKDYDYILIDSHPEVSDVLRSVIFACDWCVSPVKLDRQSSIGVATIMGVINDVNADVEMIRNVPDIRREISSWRTTEFKGSIGMMAREYSGILKWSEGVEYNRLKRIGEIFENYVTEGDGLRRAIIEHRPVYDVSTTNADKQSDQFKKVTEEFVGI